MSWYHKETTWSSPKKQEWKYIWKQSIPTSNQRPEQEAEKERKIETCTNRLHQSLLLWQSIGFQLYPIPPDYVYSRTQQSSKPASTSILKYVTNSNGLQTYHHLYRLHQMIKLLNEHENPRSGLCDSMVTFNNVYQYSSLRKLGKTSFWFWAFLFRQLQPYWNIWVSDPVRFDVQ